MNDCSSVLRDYSSKSAEHPATAPAGSSPSSYGAKGLSSRQMQDVVKGPRNSSPSWPAILRRAAFILQSASA